MVNLRNLIRIGKITAIFDNSGTVQVTFEDKDDCAVIYPLLSTEYNMPKMDDPVWCICLGNGLESGLCLGRAYDKKSNPPPVKNREIYHKPLVENSKAYFEYNNETETLTLKAKNILLECEDVVSTGNVSDSEGPMQEMREIYNTHTNPNDGAPPEKM